MIHFRPTSFEAFYVVVPLIFNSLLVATFYFAGDQLLAIGWIIYFGAFLTAMMTGSAFLAYFEDRVRNKYAWSGILGNGLLVILFFGSIYLVSGILCASAICDGAQAMPDHDKVLIYKDAVNSIYFVTVTFTTLGYGDLQPVPQLRLFAASQAFLGYVYLGFLVGAAFHWASRQRELGRKQVFRSQYRVWCSEATPRRARPTRSKRRQQARCPRTD